MKLYRERKMALNKDEDIDTIFERMFNLMGFQGKPKVQSWSYGYSMTAGQDGKPIIKEWGTGLPKMDNPLKPKPFVPETPESISQVDIDSENMRVRIIVDMPGFTKESIKITGTENKLQLSASNETRHIDNEILIQAKVDPSSAEATYKNGILDITLKLLETPKPEGLNIQVN